MLLTRNAAISRPRSTIASIAENAYTLDPMAAAIRCVHNISSAKKMKPDPNPAISRIQASRSSGDFAGGAASGEDRAGSISRSARMQTANTNEPIAKHNQKAPRIPMAGRIAYAPARAAVSAPHKFEAYARSQKRPEDTFHRSTASAISGKEAPINAAAGRINSAPRTKRAANFPSAPGKKDCHGAS